MAVSFASGSIDTIESETLSRGLFDVDELTRAFGEETGRKQIGELLQRWKHDRINLDNAISRESLSDISDTLEKLKETIQFQMEQQKETLLMYLLY